MLCNPGNGRMVIEEWLVYKTQLRGLGWNESNVTVKQKESIQTFFTVQGRRFCPLIGSPEESPAAEAADPSVVRVVGLVGWSLVAADRTDSFVVDLSDVFVNDLNLKTIHFECTITYQNYLSIVFTFKTINSFCILQLSKKSREREGEWKGYYLDIFFVNWKKFVRGHLWLCFC